MNTSSPSYLASDQGAKTSQFDTKTTRHYRLTTEEWLRVSKQLRAAELRVLYYLRTLDPFGDRKLDIGVRNVATLLNCQPGTVSRAIKVLHQKGYIDANQYFTLQEQTSQEKQIRDRLHQELGGLIEVATPVGRIDLLTNTEVIEVKHVQNWKSALGQVLAYSGFYPEHQKRIHLFGENGLAALRAAKNTCEAFRITVSYEEAQDV